MKSHRLHLLILIPVTILIFQSAIVKPVIAHPPSVNSHPSLPLQVTPTSTSLAPNGEEVYTTDPLLLQIIILLGILAVLVIFLGVWINRRQVDLQ
jgi:hypothetical protein